MSKVKANDTVKVHYTGKLTNGQVFDTSAEREPLQAQLGQGLFQKISKEELPKEIKPEVGMGLMASRPDGSQQQLRVAEVNEDHIVIDANHPLAGQDLIFDLEVVGIN